MKIAKIIIRLAASAYIVVFVLLHVHLVSFCCECAIIAATILAAVFILTYRKLIADLIAYFSVALGIVWSVLLMSGLYSNCYLGSNYCYKCDCGLRGRVMVLVPHEDDEINLMGGVLETLIRTCDVYIIFSTNGTAYGKCVRPFEACNALAKFGIKRENVYFLGFDQIPWPTQMLHMYNTAPHALAISAYGRSRTWVPEPLQCLQPNLPYTQENFVAAITNMIEHIKPDYIFVNDYDGHADHRALFLSTMKALARYARNSGNRQPEVFSGFAYSGCWRQEPDFYNSLNIGSTSNLAGSSHMEEVNCYLWDERLRLPVGQASISRTLRGNIMYEAFGEHRTQNTQPYRKTYRRFDRICNGDRVFWWHPPYNIALKAKVLCNARAIMELNDGLLYDSSNVTDVSHKPFDNGWFPASGDDTVDILWDSPQLVREIHLFDHPDENNQIKSLTVTLSNGKQFTVKDLPSYGNRYVLITNCDEKINGFTIKINEAIGRSYGLCEVEAYSFHPSSTVHVAKLQDSEGHFMYDYITNREGIVDFSVYTWGCDSDNLTVAVKNETEEGAILNKTNQSYTLSLQPGKSCFLELVKDGHEVLDVVRVSNPRYYNRLTINYARAIERYVESISLDTQVHYYSSLWHKAVCILNAFKTFMISYLKMPHCCNER